LFHEFPLTPNRYGPESGGVGKVMKLSFQPYNVLLKRTPYVAVALFLVQTVSGIRERNEVQVVDESDFNVYASDAAMSSSGILLSIGYLLNLDIGHISKVQGGVTLRSYQI
jgi:hypothetical protein